MAMICRLMARSTARPTRPVPGDWGHDGRMTRSVRHSPEASRYELVEDGTVVGVADYRLDGDVATFLHTEIVAHRRGEGLGAELVRAALDDTRARGHRIVAQCWYVAEFVAEHPEYADLLARR
jgi:predicted GNAT family acetyltransferase